jgi:hypothetical protein
MAQCPAHNHPTRNKPVSRRRRVIGAVMVKPPGGVRPADH